jgi:F420-dependent methylenetetrahydromethanopterin dehydrogenase
MSNNHVIAIVQVNAFVEEELVLDEIMGRVPTAEIIEVLESEWAKREGWQIIEKSKIYTRQFNEYVSMELQIGEGKETRLVKRAFDEVNETLEAKKEQELSRLIEETESAYNLAFNDVYGRALVQALKNHAVKEPGYEIIEKDESLDEMLHVYDLELKLKVEVYESV